MKLFSRNRNCKPRQPWGSDVLVRTCMIPANFAAVRLSPPLAPFILGALQRHFGHVEMQLLRMGEFQNWLKEHNIESIAAIGLTFNEARNLHCFLTRNGYPGIPGERDYEH